MLASAYNKMSRNYIVRLGPLKNVQYKNITPLFRTVHVALRLEREHYKYGPFCGGATRPEELVSRRKDPPP